MSEVMNTVIASEVDDREVERSTRFVRDRDLPRNAWAVHLNSDARCDERVQCEVFRVLRHLQDLLWLRTLRESMDVRVSKYQEHWIL